MILVSILSGARIAKNSYLSEKILDRMKKLFPGLSDPLSSATVLLANVYSLSGEFEKASETRMQLYKSGMKKQSGLSSTTVNGILYVS